MAEYVVYDGDTGALVRAGFVSDPDMIDYQAAGDEKHFSIRVPDGSFKFPDLDLEPLRASLAADVDRAAGNVRRVFITDTFGQDAAYQRKSIEAAMVKAGTIDSAALPYLSAEAKVRDLSLEDMADLVLSQASGWIKVDAVIEAKRQGAKLALKAAANVRDIVAAAKVDWSTITG